MIRPVEDAESSCPSRIGSFNNRPPAKPKRNRCWPPMDADDKEGFIFQYLRRIASLAKANGV